MSQRGVLGLTVALSIGASMLAAQSKTGTTVGQFLLIEPSARIAAMGNAGVTNYDEIEAAYYNPAAIGHFTGYGAQFTHSAWIADITYDYAAVGVSFGELGNLLATVTSLNSGAIDVTTIQQEHGTGESYTVSDLAFGLGYGRQISEHFFVGFQVSYLQETIWHSSMSAFALNVGTIYRLSPNGLHIGASISNFGTRGKYDGRDLRIQYGQDPTQHGQNSNLPAELYTDDFPLPVLFRVGIGYPLALGEENIIRVEVDAFHPSDNIESVSLGAEWSFNKMFFLRGGYQNPFQHDSELGLTLGAGLRYALSDFAFTFDYGWADQGRLGASHRLTLGAEF
jgi:hypothetical protein